MALTISKHSNQLSNLPSKPLTEALKVCSSEGNSAQLVKVSSDLAKRDIDNDRQIGRELKADIEKLRREYIEVSKREQSEEKALMLTAIKQEGEAKKQALAKLPSYTLIKTMNEAEPERLRAQIIVMLRSVSKFLNIGKNLQIEQLQEVAEYVVEQSKGLSLEDLAVMFHRAKAGDFGQIYDRLDGAVVLGWLKKYKEERQERLALKAQNQHAQTKFSGDRVSKRILDKTNNFLR